MKNGIKDYKDLKVWQKAVEVVCDIIELVDMLPPGPAREIIGKQILGSSTSVCANIAEGHSSGITREYNRKLRKLIIGYRSSKEVRNLPYQKSLHSLGRLRKRISKSLRC